MSQAIKWAEVYHSLSQRHKGGSANICIWVYVINFNIYASDYSRHKENACEIKETNSFVFIELPSKERNSEFNMIKEQVIRTS